MNKEEFIGKLQMVYVGDKRASKEIISEYDRLKDIINQKESMYDNLAVDYRLEQEEIDRLNNIINELEKYIHNELVLDFYNDDMPCELIINKMEKMIKELKENNK